MEKEQKPEDEPVHWEPVSNIDKEEQKRQEIIKAVEDHHKMYVDLWLSHFYHCNRAFFGFLHTNRICV